MEVLILLPFLIPHPTDNNPNNYEQRITGIYYAYDLIDHDLIDALLTTLNIWEDAVKETTRYSVRQGYVTDNYADASVWGNNA
ncbi:hypothetical protein OH492_12285 [Vibrio chagasii]|nr:hypothetical protein [Vibrio chagasii]